MKILHHMKRERSGLAFTTLELVKFEERQGHAVAIREPSGDAPIYRSLSYNGSGPDVHAIHSQLRQDSFFDRKPRFMWMHGEPLSSVGNGISMKAIVDLAPKVDAFIAMREDELPIWSSLKRTYYVPKGIDLEQFRPLQGVTERLSGEPAVLYAEHWRGQRNPLYLCIAMEKVWKKLPKARLHLFNCTDKRMLETFSALISSCKWWSFVRSLKGPEQDANLLYNRCDIVVSCLYPLYARSIEAMGAGRAFIGPGYREHEYPYTCNLDPDSIADAILRCWDEWGQFDFRRHAETHHDVSETVRQSVQIYGRYL